MDNGTIGWLTSLPVVENRALRYDQALVVSNRIVAGEAKHVAYLIALGLIKHQARRDLEQLLDAFAARWGVTR